MRELLGEMEENKSFPMRGVFDLPSLQMNDFYLSGPELYKVKRVKLKLSFCLLIAQEVKDKFFRKKLIFNFPQLSK